MNEVLKKTYEAAMAARQAAETRRNELSARFEQFKDSVVAMWDNLNLKEEKFTLKDGTCLSVSTKGLAFNGPATNAILNEAEEVISRYLEAETKRYDEMYVK